METEKIHQRVLEIQKSIETAEANQQTLMLKELLDVISQVEQSITEIKLDINEIENKVYDEKKS